MQDFRCGIFKAVLNMMKLRAIHRTSVQDECLVSSSRGSFFRINSRDIHCVGRELCWKRPARK